MLHLATYHQSYQWTDDIHAGLAEVLSRHDSGPFVGLLVECRDAKRTFDETHQQNLARLLRHKFAGHR